MGNHIIGQTTDDIIEIIKFHGKLNVKVKNKDRIVNRNVTINRVNRYIFNHNFNRNRYVRNK